MTTSTTTITARPFLLESARDWFREVLAEEGEATLRDMIAKMESEGQRGTTDWVAASQVYDFHMSL